MIPWTAAHQASLPITNSWGLLRLMSIELVMPSKSSSVIPFSSHLQFFPASGSFLMRWPKYWSCSFSISPSNDYSRLISFRIDWFDLHAVPGTLESSPAQFKSINSLVLSLLYGLTLTSIQDYWKGHSFDYMSICRQSGISAF